MLDERYKECGSPMKGGMSTVEKYLDRHLDRIVVLKTIDNDDDKHRLYDEIVALMSLRSNHVVQIYDIVIGKDGLSGFIEEFIDGEDLINQYSDTPEEIIKIIWQIAAGIRDIHSKDVIHRDIKPQNIKVDNEGIVKIFDFGLAKVNADSASTIGVKGTPLYSAPELMKGGHVPLTKAADVYSFAVTCAQLCGIDPFHFSAKNGTLSGIFNHQTIINDHKLINLFDECIHDIPENRPSIKMLEERLRQIILRGKHRALLTYETGTGVITKELDSKNRGVNLRVKDIGEIKIEYTEYQFIVTSASGEIAVNNMDAHTGMEMPGSCVISIGSAQRPYNQRSHITFDSSWPEVIV